MREFTRPNYQDSSLGMAPHETAIQHTATKPRRTPYPDRIPVCVELF
ncbi:hypothetical protein HMPREF0578_0089 [Mobiluncus mulieris 28-1]|uniref:Uncharacterized protein n=1 Tax=Mobiluncus mulieris TaxID=2052 RepID=A0A848RMB5_9ACTO|nr:hypothetical protein [Mobiluncus mulieris]EEZ90185.1 hypothetical protein HMPREF0578_0089 [Mobiluncus mulieris 28-1]NMW92501.1 hypothetical protein [Mobiluncus mulieris]